MAEAIVTGTPRYLDAVNRALADEMEASSDVIVLGVDVGRSGGPYGVTRGLYERFGAERVLDTPIAEAGVLGAAVGAAMAGLRPVAEIMYMDFIGVCLDPIINQAAKLGYMTGGAVRVPVVFRTQTGGGRSAGAQHSQSLEGILAHIPGLDVYCPADSRDAYDLLVAGIRADHPVCFIENRRLYGKRHGAWDREALSPGRARIVRGGDDVTVIAWGRMVAEAQAAIDSLGRAGSIELIDLRTLVPLDVDTVVSSVARTGRALVVHEAVERYGPGGEIVSRIAERALFDLDGPVRRFGALPSPVPYSPGLERAVLPEAAGIARAIRHVLEGGTGNVSP
jgi:pyruvate/2-oxoglutarate/acetoin dehydrogenase E1 component